MGKTATSGPSDGKAEYDPAQRRSFLISVKNSKKNKRKKAEKLAKETMKQVRAERRVQKREAINENIKELVKKQSKLGIKALPIFAQEEKQIVMAEVDAANPTEITLTEVGVDEEPN